MYFLASFFSFHNKVVVIFHCIDTLKVPFWGIGRYYNLKKYLLLFIDGKMFFRTALFLLEATFARPLNSGETRRQQWLVLGTYIGQGIIRNVL